MKKLPYSKQWDEGMIVVAGCGRSGTSMVMQTLKILGMPISAPAFIKENAHVKEFNKKGYYELNLTDGIKDDSFKGQAVKLFGGQLARTDKSLISRMIYIRRTPADAIASYEKMKDKMPKVDATSAQLYYANRKHFLAALDNDTLCVSYEEVLANPARFVAELLLYLQFTPVKGSVIKAIKNIKK